MDYILISKTKIDAKIQTDENEVKMGKIQSWRVENRMKVIFSDKLKNCVGQADATGTSVWGCSNYNM